MVTYKISTFIGSPTKCELIERQEKVVIGRITEKLVDDFCYAIHNWDTGEKTAVPSSLRRDESRQLAKVLATTHNYTF